MYRMLGDISDHWKKIEPSGDKRVNMWCHTCHHGRPRPMTLDEELGEQYRKKVCKPHSTITPTSRRNITGARLLILARAR